MGYHDFAFYYDELNGEADYHSLVKQLQKRLCQHGVYGGLVVDLGCGTGEITLQLAALGYDLISVDISGEMLTVLREKIEENNLSSILLLQQDLKELDLFGTVRAAVCTYDTLNHIEPQSIDRVIERVSLFLEPGGVFLFDANTPYKHKHVLKNNTFEIETPNGLCCIWQNTLLEKEKCTEIELEIIKNNYMVAHEHFFEYIYTLSDFEKILNKNGLICLDVVDGENFGALREDSQRYFFTCVKTSENR